MAQAYVWVKLFDLAQAPPDLRDASALADLRPAPGRSDVAILELEVGSFESLGLHDGAPRRAITATEYRLHRWLETNGASQGEAVFLRWPAGRAASAARPS